MSEYKKNSQLKEIFILAKGNSNHLFEKLICDIEIIQGQIRHAFPPKVIIASIPTGKIKELLVNSSVEFLTADEIDNPPPIFSADGFLDIISIWNKQIKDTRDTADKTRTDEDLSWDAPGHLPPDPPPKFRKMMRDWEKNMNKSTDNQ
jgi:hypothetical protein